MGQTGNSNAAIVALGWFTFRYECRHPLPGGSLMKPVDIGSSIGLDRLATLNEVMRAISVSAEGVFPLGGAYPHLAEMDSAFRDSACNLSEDDMWMEIMREMPDSKSN